jgi:hypothetical protein
MRCDAMRCDTLRCVVVLLCCVVLFFVGMERGNAGGEGSGYMGGCSHGSRSSYQRNGPKNNKSQSWPMAAVEEYGVRSMGGFAWPILILLSAPANKHISSNKTSPWETMQGISSTVCSYGAGRGGLE